MVHDELACAALEGSELGVRRVHELQRAFLEHIGAAEDLGGVRVHAEPQLVAQAGVRERRCIRRRGEDVAHGARADQRIEQQRRNRRGLQLPEAPVLARHARVPGEAGVKALAHAVLDAIEYLLQGVLLRGRKAVGGRTSRARRDIPRKVKGCLAGGPVLHDAVLGAVQGIAFREDAAAHEIHGGLRECVLGQLAWPGRLHELLRVPDLLHGRLGQVVARIARHQPVELVGKPRRRHHRPAAAVGAAQEVRALRRAAVGQFHDLLGRRGDAAHGVVSVVGPRLRVEPERRIGLARGVPAIAAHHRIALAQRVAVGVPELAQGRGQHTVRPFAALVQELAVPGFGHAHFVADGVRFSVHPRALVERAGDLAVDRVVFSGGAVRFLRNRRGAAHLDARELEGFRGDRFAGHGHGAVPAAASASRQQRGHRGRAR